MTPGTPFAVTVLSKNLYQKCIIGPVMNKPTLAIRAVRIGSYENG